MITDDGPLTFALTLKRWFAQNNWPQRITEDWAKDAGVGCETGPWASQMCGAMKGAGYNPKVEFFLALAEFNHFVFEQQVKNIVSKRTRDRLDGADALCHDNGLPFTAPDFWSLYAGLIQPPEKFASNTQEFTKEDAEAWVTAMRNSFREVSLKHMVSRSEAWQMIKKGLIEIGDRQKLFLSPDDLSWVQEMLAGFLDPEPEQLVQMGKRWGNKQPLMDVFDELLKEDFSKKQNSAV